MVVYVTEGDARMRESDRESSTKEKGGSVQKR